MYICLCVCPYVHFKIAIGKRDYFREALKQTPDQCSFMQGALIEPFRTLKQTSGEREFILIPFWNLRAFIDRYLLLIYAFLVTAYSCTVLYCIFFCLYMAH